MEARKRSAPAEFEGALPRGGPGRFYFIVKRCFDAAFSLLCLLLLSPVFLIVALAIRGADGGPAIYRRRCRGARGYYDMLKFRTMAEDADDLAKYMTPEQIAEYRANVKLRRDPRITKIGRFLRRTSLDELPQLVNVLRGEMSVVGPRPVTEEELVYFGADGAALLAAKPGITGYWQISGRGDRTYPSGERQRLEMYYVAHRGFRLDAYILLRTIPAVLSERGSL